MEHPKDTHTLETDKNQPMCIVITGYGPFGDHKINASWEAVKKLQDLWSESQYKQDVHLVTEEIPVCYKFVQQEVPNKWTSSNAGCNILAMLHVGVSHLAKRITIEEQANNNGYTKCDINGTCPDDGRCVSDVVSTSGINVKQDLNNISGDYFTMNEEDTFLKTTFNVDELVDHINAALEEEAAEKSRDAGRYLCEFVYFKSLHSMNRKALFIHVPTLDIFTADKSAQAIKLIADYIINNARGKMATEEV